MKINLINDNQLQIIVTKNDMFGKDMRALFRDIIEQAKHEFGFEVLQNTSLMVEAYPLSEESMILTITKVKSDELDLKFFNSVMEENEPAEPWAVFEFETLDDVLTLAENIERPVLCESILYGFKGQYLLYVQDVNRINETSRGYFVEYGEISQYSKDFLDEHAKVIIGAQALNILGHL